MWAGGALGGGGGAATPPFSSMSWLLYGSTDPTKELLKTPSSLSGAWTNLGVPKPNPGALGFKSAFSDEVRSRTEIPFSVFSISFLLARRSSSMCLSNCLDLMSSLLSLSVCLSRSLVSLSLIFSNIASISWAESSFVGFPFRRALALFSLAILLLFSCPLRPAEPNTISPDKLPSSSAAMLAATLEGLLDASSVEAPLILWGGEIPLLILCMVLPTVLAEYCEDVSPPPLASLLSCSSFIFWSVVLATLCFSLYVAS
mmetsp:Transcript_23339/g.43877  ORF Transcript_23339/g.43877 Transcript_23339/m.43877 type:complete len:258 (-) Transcript_23339:408-1181(-)